MIESPFHLHFLDSGSFSLRQLARKHAESNRCSQWEFYDTDDHWEYLDDYATFVKKYRHAIDYYANVDVIGSPELSWRNLKYLERKHGLQPVPVIHYGSSMDWLKRHLKEGYEFIGLGGMIAKGGFGVRSSSRWLDGCFDLICNSPDRLPQVRTHGFGMAGPYAVRYPWWSIDTAGWAKASGFGKVMVPHKRRGRWVFDFPAPYLLPVSELAPQQKEKGRHLFSISKAERALLYEWFDKEIEVPIGKTGDDGSVIEKGIINDTNCRRVANIKFYEIMRRSIPPYPWPWSLHVRKGFDL